MRSLTPNSALERSSHEQARSHRPRSTTAKKHESLGISWRSPQNVEGPSRRRGKCMSSTLDAEPCWFALAPRPNEAGPFAARKSRVRNGRRRLRSRICLTALAGPKLFSRRQPLEFPPHRVGSFPWLRGRGRADWSTQPHHQTCKLPTHARDTWIPLGSASDHGPSLEPRTTCVGELARSRSAL